MAGKILYLALGLSGIAAVVSVISLIEVRDLAHVVKQIEPQPSTPISGSVSVPQNPRVTKLAPQTNVTPARSTPQTTKIVQPASSRDDWEVTYRGGEEVINIGEFREVDAPASLEITNDEPINIGEFRRVDG